jgi:glycosyltransferase involved in cell wall biosynthesis
MRIAVLSTTTYSTMPLAYGGEASFGNLAKGLCEAGHDVVLYGAPGSQPPHENCRCTLRYIPGTYSEGTFQREWLLAEWFYDEVMASDYVLDCSLNHPVAEWAGWYNPEHQKKIAVVLNGTTSHVPRCGLYNTVVGSNKWKELLVYGRTQFYSTPFEAQYGASIEPVPEEAFLGIVPFWTDVNFYTPGGSPKEDYYLFLCYDDQTEILTRQSWKLFKDLLDTDQVATLNSAGEMEFHTPVAKQRFYYNGEMVHFKGRGYDLLVTPNHEVYCRFCTPHKRNTRTFKKIPAHELATLLERWGSSHRPELKRDCFWVGEDHDYFTLPRVEYAFRPPLTSEMLLEAKRLRSEGYSYHSVARDLSSTRGATVHAMAVWTSLNETRGRDYPERKLPMNLWLQFLGWWLSEGWCEIRGDKHYRIGLANTNKELIDGMMKVARDLGYHPSLRLLKRQKVTHRPCWQIHIYDKQLYLYLKEFGKAREKWIPEEIKALPPQRLRILLEALLDGDGHRDGSSWTYYTTSTRLADDVQEIAIKAGYHATVSRSKSQPIWLVIGGQSQKTPQIMSKATREGYTGFVYDVTVPNHTILVRRMGRAVWSGNSRPTPYKGLGQALELAAERKLHLKIVPGLGAASHRVELEQHRPQIEAAIARGAQVEVVVLPQNSQHHVLKRELYRRARALLAPVQAHEPFGLTIIESLASGTPVIASRMGAFPEIINHGETGFLCSNKAQYLEAIDNVGDLPAGAARADAEARWHYLRGAKDYLKLLEG